MRKTLLIAAVLFTFAHLTARAGSAQTQTVDLVLGTIVEPAGIKRGDTLRQGALIQSGADGLIVFSEQWPSGLDGFTCVGVTLVGYGASETVQRRATEGRCVARAILVPPPGQPVISRGTRYAQGKTDVPAPPQVVAAENEWSGFDDWKRKASQQGDAGKRPPTGALSQKPSGMGPLVRGLVYLQADYRSAPTSSAEACAALCDREPQCRAMTFIISQQLCWLKSSVPATATSNDMISASKNK